MDSTLSPALSQQAAQANYSSGLQASATNSLTNAGTQTPAKIKKAAQDFEAFFAGQMMEYMSAGIKSDGEFGGGQAENTWRSMLNQEYGKEIAKSGTLGIAKTVSAAMLQAQEKRNAASALTQPSTSTDTDVTASTATNPSITQAAIAAGSMARSQSVYA